MTHENELLKNNTQNGRGGETQDRLWGEGAASFLLRQSFLSLSVIDDDRTAVNLYIYLHLFVSLYVHIFVLVCVCVSRQVAEFLFTHKHFCRLRTVSMIQLVYDRVRLAAEEERGETKEEGAAMRERQR